MPNPPDKVDGANPNHHAVREACEDSGEFFTVVNVVRGRGRFSGSGSGRAVRQAHPIKKNRFRHWMGAKMGNTPLVSYFIPEK